MDNRVKKGIKIGIGAAAGVAAVAIPVKAALFRPEKIEAGENKPENVDLERFRKNLSDAIKIRTIASDDPETMNWEPFIEFHDFLRERYPLIHEKLSLKVFHNEKGAMLFKWEGKNTSLEPIALLSHQDVVPISEGTWDDWVNPPFDGVDDGEFIWGRGALDMKNHLIAVCEAVETLLEEGFEPERTVYLCFGHNEEVMTSIDSGAVTICNYFKENGIHLDSIIDEGGAILPINIKGVINKNLCGIGLGEKGYADVEVAINAKGGHSSASPNHTAIGQLAECVRDIENHQFKGQLSPMMMQLFDKLARNCSYPVRLVSSNYKLLSPVILKILEAIPAGASMVRTVTGVTMASGSPAPNVLPQRATVNVNFRMFPGETIDDVTTHLKKVIRNKKAEITVRPGWKNPSAISPTDSRAFKAMEEIGTAINPDNIVAPYLVMGGTDACHYEPVCENIYRFSPFLVNTELLLTTHGTNERIPVSCMADGVAFFKRYIRRLAGE